MMMTPYYADTEIVFGTEVPTVKDLGAKIQQLTGVEAVVEVRRLRLPHDSYWLGLTMRDNVLLVDGNEVSAYTFNATLAAACALGGTMMPVHRWVEPYAQYRASWRFRLWKIHKGCTETAVGRIAFLVLSLFSELLFLVLIVPILAVRALFGRLARR